MKRKIISVIIIIIFILVATLLCGCEKTNEASAPQTQSFPKDTVELASGRFVRIGDISPLYYHSVTHVVYVGAFTQRADIAFTPFYSEQGYLYRFDPDTGKMEEIIH